MVLDIFLSDFSYSFIRPFGLLVPKEFKIIWLYILSILCVPDEGYSRKMSCALNLISTFVFTSYSQANHNHHPHQVDPHSIIDNTYL